MNDSVDRKALLDDLKIDRNAPPADSGRPLKWFALIAIIGGAVFALWFLDIPGSDQAIPVKTAVARSSAVQTTGSSVLDATGYVVARRQATVSSKATGKVVEVLIEEGIVVTEGQLLARLDDTIIKSEYDKARAPVVGVDPNAPKNESISLKKVTASHEASPAKEQEKKEDEEQPAE